MILSTWPTVVPFSTASTRSPSSRGAASAGERRRRRAARARPTASAGAGGRACRRSGGRRGCRRRAGAVRHRATSLSAARLGSRVTTRRYAGFVVEQLGVGAGGDDPAVVEERDLVGGVEHQRAGRGDDGGAAGAVAAQPGRDPGLGVGVDGRGRLDQHQDLGVGRRAPGPAPAAAAGRRRRCGRARRRRCRGRSGSASRTSSADAVSSARSTSPWPVTSSRSPSRPEKNSGAGVGDDDPAAYLGAGRARSAARRRGGPRRRLGARGHAEPVGERGRLVGLLADDRGEQPGADAAARCGRRPASEPGGRRRRERRRARRPSGSSASTRADPARPRPGRGSACWRTRSRCAAGSSGTPSSRRTRPARRG